MNEEKQKLDQQINGKKYAVKCRECLRKFGKVEICLYPLEHFELKYGVKE